MNRIIDITGETAEISLPIVKFPPLSLTALLVEKDPVVWAHLLETYVEYFEFLMTNNNLEQLDASTFDHLCIFIRSYIHEMALNVGNLASLGMNHDVTEQSFKLRCWIFQMIKDCGLLHLQIYGETLWDLVKLFVEENPVSVRSLIDSSLKPKINTQKAQLNRIHQLQQQLKHIIESGNFTRVDLKAFQALLSKKSLKPNKFSEQFLTPSWVETIELLWAKGKGRANVIARQLLITTLLSVPAKSIANVMKELGISDIDTLLLYPLLGCILINEKFQARIPNLLSTVGFLNVTNNDQTTDDNVDSINDDFPQDINSNEAEPFQIQIKQEDLNALGELFPGLSNYQKTVLLQRYDSNVELVTNLLFEDPSIIDNIPQVNPSEPKAVKNRQSAKKIVSLDKEDETQSELELDTNHIKSASKNEMASITKKHVPDELRNKTLTRALKLLYDDDEDERDDTYDEAEVNRSNTKIGLDTDNDNDGDVAEETSQQTKKTAARYDAIEGYLWQLLKEDKSLFERSKRGSKVRKDMKQQTNWSDEQIEGWSRMLERSPQRARILEEKFMFRGNKRSGKTSFVQNRDQDTDQELPSRGPSWTPKQQSNAKNNRDHNRNLRKKANNSTDKKSEENNGTKSDKNKVQQERKNPDTKSDTKTEANTENGTNKNKKKKASKSSHNRKSGFR
ncbi:Cue3p NDAI_0I01430 [Naumovozyma dairenensis CBS 421]|uniref:CUE domain-containing protein n=1 Tax=Naumovozyma dairenensis (strain ATCC 10597 / BCRC 20456 / CBS 421 / NBRC 0211 / NRRL Y-12639) TaxID=1071378 RepID=G0WG01_NAUDC|nr:hypothetical protein NDAI_0I01430 [Naumovozyma dairenensis CBS 421]CCD26712.1 hypothetical protein NDAI_0I01430 [Naumovozyma dairenensis CBS 421]